jgi:hypothetical protein
LSFADGGVTVVFGRVSLSDGWVRLASRLRAHVNNAPRGEVVAVVALASWEYPGLVRVFVGVPVWPRLSELRGRRLWRKVLDDLVEAVRPREGGALALYGKGGVGKTAGLDYLAGHASSCRVARWRPVRDGSRPERGPAS